MKKIGLGLLNLSIAFVLLFSGMSGLGDVLLNAAEVTAANTQNESETTTSVGDEETSEVVEETTTEETTVAVEESTAIVEESTDVIKSASEESNMAVQAAISEEEQQLLNQLNPRMKSLESDQKDFLSTEDTPESFIVFLKEDKQLYNAATEVFSASAGKSVAPELSTLIVKKDEASLPDEQFINTLSNLSSVESVVKNTVSQMTNYEVSSEELDTTVVENFSTVDSYGVPNDPNYAIQWEMQQMQMPKVWDLGNGKGVKIGVFDTGFQAAYRDTTGVEFDTNRILPLVKYAEDNACYSYGEHGTMVLSIAGAVKSNNGIGMAGVASGATFQPYIAGYSCSKDGFGLNSANFVKVYEHALANGVNIMNMSFGGTRYIDAENTVIQRATQKGLISVAARGNDGRKSNPTIANYPACYSGVVMVGALTQSNTLADFSTYTDCGNKNLVTAYGANVTVAMYRTDGLYRALVDGTSFSSPITAGVLAVMKSANPTATSTELKNALFSTATDLGTSGYDQKYGYGGINPLAAVKKANPYIIVDGMYTFYLNSDKTIRYAERKEGGKITAYYEYYAGSKYDASVGENVKYVFYLSANGTISYAQEQQQNTKKIVAYYEYNSGVKYGQHPQNQTMRYYINGVGEIGHAEKITNNSVEYVATYYPGAKYQYNKLNYMKYIFYLNGDMTIKYAREQEKVTMKIKTYFEYSSGIKYGQHVNKESIRYYMNGAGFIGHAEKVKNGVIEYIATYYDGAYYSKNKLNYMKYITYLNANGTIQYAREQEKTTMKVKKYIEFGLNVKYGQHLNKESAIYYMKPDNKIGHVERMNNGIIKSIALYYDDAYYFGNKVSHVKYVFQLSSDKTIIRADEYQKNTQKLMKTYYYQKGTKYGENHNSKISKTVTY